MTCPCPPHVSVVTCFSLAPGALPPTEGLHNGLRNFVVSSAAPPSTRSPLAAFAAVFLLAAACAGALVWTLERQERAQQRTQAADVAGDHVQALQRAKQSPPAPANPVC